MANELVPASGGFMALAGDDLQALAMATSDMGGSGGGPFLKHDGKTGEYNYGSNDEELAEGSELAVDIMSLERGYICWKEEKVVGEYMQSFRDGMPPPKHQMDMSQGPFDDGDGWADQTTIKVKMVVEPFTEMTAKFTGVSKLNAVGRLVKDLLAQIKFNMGKVPIVEIGNQTFESKAKGAKKALVYAPTFKIVEWVDPAELQAAVEGDENDYSQANPEVDGETQEPEPELEQAPAQPAPAAASRRAAPAQPAAQPPAAASPAAQTRAAGPAPARRRGQF